MNLLTVIVCFPPWCESFLINVCAFGSEKSLLSSLYKSDWNTERQREKKGKRRIAFEGVIPIWLEADVVQVIVLQVLKSQIKTQVGSQARTCNFQLKNVSKQVPS